MSSPRHIAIIPDGNRRWAKANNQTTPQGHAAGYKNLKRMADAAFERGAEFLTAYAFSTENWLRTPAEVSALMKLAGDVIAKESNYYIQKGIKIRFWGAETGLKPSLVDGLRNIENTTALGTNGTLNLCFNYGGRADIVAAAQVASEKGELNIEGIEQALVSHGTPAPDLIIRTGGERRLSNFLLWESAYSELYFTDTLWPAFDESELDLALADYAARKRNFGK